MPGIELSEGLLELVAVGDSAGCVRRGRHVDLLELDLDHPPSSTSGEIEAGIDGQAVHPGIEPIGVAQTRKVAPGADQRLLDRIARELRVPEDEAGGRVQSRDGQVDERGEGVMIAPLCPNDQISLVHGPSPSAARLRWTCSLGYGAGVGQTIRSGLKDGQDDGDRMVEMRGLEPLTPAM